MKLRRLVQVMFLLALHLNVVLCNSYPNLTGSSSSGSDTSHWSYFMMVFFEECAEINEQVAQGEESESSHETSKTFNEPMLFSEWLVLVFSKRLLCIERSNIHLPAFNAISGFEDIIGEPPELV